MVDVNIRMALRRQTLADLKAEYAELWDSWKVVESKAQPIAAIAGAFLAGAFAYVGQLKGASIAEQIVLLVVVGLLIVCAVSALCAIWITDVASPYLSSEGVDEVEDMLQISADVEELRLRRERMMLAAISRWASACDGLRTALGRKRSLLNRCLGTLSVAGCLCVPLVLLMMYGRAVG